MEIIDNLNLRFGEDLGFTATRGSKLRIASLNGKAESNCVKYDVVDSYNSLLSLVTA